MATPIEMKVLDGDKLPRIINTPPELIDGKMPVLLASAPLPTGAATEASLAAIKTALGSPLQAGGAVQITGTPAVTIAGVATDGKVEAVRALLAGTLAVSGPLTAAQLASAGMATDARLAEIKALLTSILAAQTAVAAAGTEVHQLADGSAGLAAGASTTPVTVDRGDYFMFDAAFSGTNGSLTLQRLGADGATYIDVVTRNAPGSGDPVGIPNGSVVRLTNKSSVALTTVAARLS